MQEIEVAARIAYADLRLCHLEGNVERALDWFHSDATLFPPGEAPVTGIEQIKDYLAGWYSKTQILDVAIQIVECGRAGSLAYDIAKYEIKTKTSSLGTTFVERGSHLVIWRPNSSGDWRIHRDMAAVEAIAEA